MKRGGHNGRHVFLLRRFAGMGGIGFEPTTSCVSSRRSKPTELTALALKGVYIVSFKKYKKARVFMRVEKKWLSVQDSSNHSGGGKGLLGVVALDSYCYLNAFNVERRIVVFLFLECHTGNVFAQQVISIVAIIVKV